MPVLGQPQLLVRLLAQIAMLGRGHQSLVLLFLLNASSAGMAVIRCPPHPRHWHHALLAMLVRGLFLVMLFVLIAMLERGLQSPVPRRPPNALFVMQVLTRLWLQPIPFRHAMIAILEHLRLIQALQLLLNVYCSLSIVTQDIITPTKSATVATQGLGLH
jgi:hypothetical protein